MSLSIRLLGFSYNVEIFQLLSFTKKKNVYVSQDTQNPSCLKQFLDHHGLSLLWIFMVELSEAKGNSANNTKLQLEVRYVTDFEHLCGFIPVKDF